MDKRNLTKELETLIKEEKKYQFIKDASFNNENDFKEYQKKHSESFTRLSFILKRKRELNFELMSEIEKQEFLEYQSKLREKYSDE
jgi:hypothetical protein